MGTHDGCGTQRGLERSTNNNSLPRTAHSILGISGLRLLSPSFSSVYCHENGRCHRTGHCLDFVVKLFGVRGIKSGDRMGGRLGGMHDLRCGQCNDRQDYRRHPWFLECLFLKKSVMCARKLWPQAFLIHWHHNIWVCMRTTVAVGV